MLPVGKGNEEDAHCEGVNPFGTFVKMRTKPIKDIYIRHSKNVAHQSIKKLVINFLRYNFRVGLQSESGIH